MRILIRNNPSQHRKTTNPKMIINRDFLGLHTLLLLMIQFTYNDCR